MPINAQTVINAIEGSGGNKTVIAKRLGVSRSHVYTLLDKFATANDAYEQESRRVADGIESTAHKLALEGNTALIIYLMKVHPGLREKYGAEVRKIQIEGNLDITLINATIKALTDIGKDPAEVFNKLIAAAVNADG